MPRTTEGLNAEFGATAVTLNGSGNSGTVAVTFTEVFATPPEVKLIKPDGDAGTYTVTVGPSITGFSFTITGSTRINTTGKLAWVAMERRWAS